MENLKILTVYTHYGHTYQFRNVRNIVKINNVVHFEYVGVSSGKVSKGEILNVAMFSTTDETNKKIN